MAKKIKLKSQQERDSSAYAIAAIPNGDEASWEEYDAKKETFELRKRYLTRIARANDIPSTLKAFQAVMALYAENGCTESEVRTITSYLNVYSQNIERLIGKELQEKFRSLEKALVVIQDKAESNVRGTTFSDSEDIYSLTGMK